QAAAVFVERQEGLIVAAGATGAGAAGARTATGRLTRAAACLGAAVTCGASASSARAAATVRGVRGRRATAIATASVSPKPDESQQRRCPVPTVTLDGFCLHEPSNLRHRGGKLQRFPGVGGTLESFVGVTLGASGGVLTTVNSDVGLGADRPGSAVLDWGPSLNSRGRRARARRAHAILVPRGRTRPQRPALAVPVRALPRGLVSDARQRAHLRGYLPARWLPLLEPGVPPQGRDAAPHGVPLE